MKKMYVKENVPTERLETMLFYIVLSTLIGARLGHVVFYDWEYYQSHLLEIFLPIEKTTNGYTFTGFRGPSKSWCCDRYFNWDNSLSKNIQRKNFIMDS